MTPIEKLQAVDPERASKLRRYMDEQRSADPNEGFVWRTLRILGLPTEGSATARMRRLGMPAAVGAHDGDGAHLDARDAGATK